MSNEHRYRRGGDVKFCAVYLVEEKEVGRSGPIDMEMALKLVQRYNKRNKNSNKRSYFEEAVSVKHLPVTERP